MCAPRAYVREKATAQLRGFSFFKFHLNCTSSDLLHPSGSGEVDIYEYCAVMRHAYYPSFTRENIKSSFKRVGIWPQIHPVYHPFPDLEIYLHLTRWLIPTSYCIYYRKKLAKSRDEILGADAKVLQFGFLDTTRGGVLTSSKAEAAVRNKHIRDRKRKSSPYLNRLEKSLLKSNANKSLRMVVKGTKLQN